MTRAIEPEELLVEVAWLRRLAVRLAGDDEQADDLAQAAVVAAWQKQPEARGSVRPWLGKVVRDGVRMLRRGRARRAAREGVVTAATVRTPDELLAEARLHQALVTAVLALDEPYRRTILARFVEGLSAVEVAARDGVPAATVRWRQAEALRRLRVALDEHAPRRAWIGVIGALVRPTSWLLRGALIAAVAVAAVIALAVWRSGRGGGDGTSVADDRRGQERVAVASQPMALASTAPSTWQAAGAMTRRVAGRVVDEADRPIAGADVVLDATIAEVGGEAGVQRVRTDGDGRFELTPRWAVNSVLTASATAYAATSVLVDPRGRVGAEPGEILVRLGSCAHRLIGTVRDAGGGPIAAARIRRRPPIAGRGGAEAVTDVDGRWTLCLPAGPEWIEIGAIGYEHVLREVTIYGEQGLDVDLVPAATARGVVRDAASGAPVAGAQVTLWPSVRRAGGPSERGARTDADGGFAIDGLAAGEFELTVWAAGYANVSRHDVWVMAASDRAPLEVRLTAAATVRGVVRGEGVAVVGAEVWLERPGPTPLMSETTVTDADGAFVLTRVPAGAGLVPQVRGWQVRAPRTIDGGVAAPVVLEVERRAVLRGEVARHERPVPDAEIVAVGPDGARTGRSDGRGRFVIEGLGDGPYRVTATARAAGAFTTAPTAVTVPTAASITLTLDGGGAITGRVLDRDGAPVSGAVVTAQELGSDEAGSGVTALDGGFAIDALAGGRYRLRVDAYRGAVAPLAWNDAPPSVVVLAGGDARVGPVVLRVLREAEVVAGRVLDRAGAPVADAFVRLGPAWAGGGAPTTRTAVDGGFVLPTRGPGPFVIDAGQGGGPAAVARGVRAGQRDLVLTLVAPGRLEGSLPDADGAAVTIRRAGGFDGAALFSYAVRRTDVVDGRFAFDGLEPGAWYATATSATGVLAVAAIEIRPGEVARLALAVAARRSIVARVVAFGSGAPIPGVGCAAGPALGLVRPVGFGARSPGAAVTDARGEVRLDAPRGPTLVVCERDLGWSMGAATIDAAGEVTIALVRKPDRTPAGFGGWFDADRLDATVAGVTEPTPAGLVVGDRVIAVDGVDVTALYADAIAWLLAGRPYGPVTVTVDRAGARRDVTLVVAPGLDPR